MDVENDRCLNFGRNLRRFRLARDLSQEKLSELAGLDRNYVTEAERGRMNPTLKTIGKLADALGVRDIDLISDTREDADQPSA